MLVSKTIPNLINGVSQQPDSLRFPTQCESQENAYPSVVDGLTKRMPTEHLMDTGIDISDGTEKKTFIHTINRDETERYSLIIRDQYIKAFNLTTLAEVTVDTPDGVTYLDTDNADTAFRAATIADVTFIVNTEKTVGTTGTTPTSANTYEALVFVKQSASTGNYSVTIDGTTKTQAANVDVSVITSGLADSIDDITGISASSSGPVIYITGTSDFTITTSSPGSDTYMQSFKDSVQRFTDLPTHAEDGMILKIEGDPVDSIDDYYVKFVSNGTASAVGEGLWQECAAPGVTKSLDSATMPHILIRQVDGTFVFKKADGAEHDGNDYSAFSWGDRLAGDDETNPMPTVVDQKIRDVFLFKNRLGFLAGENILLSESGQFFNFIRITVVDLLDTAPIDVASAHNRVSVLHHAIPYTQKLVVFADQDQFILTGGGVLTPKTVSISHSTSYDCLLNTTPVSVGAAVMFPFNRGGYSGVREYLPREGVEEVFESADISAHIPQYIPGKITKIAAATHEDVVIFMCDGDTTSLYVYNYHDTGPERLQSAWHKFDFGSDATIIGADFIESELYLIIHHTDGVFIEKMAFESGKTDTSPTTNYVTRLDRRAKFTGVSGNWNATTKLYTITLPYQKQGRNIEVMTSTGVRFSPTISDGDTSFTVGTDLTDVVFYVGEAYTMSYEMSDITLKEPSPGGGRAVIADGRAQLRYGTLVYADSSFFTVEVTPDYRDTNTHKFTGRVLGSGNMLIGSVPQESGEFRFPVFSKANQVSIFIKNDSPLPSNLMSAEFELNWSPRAERIGL